MTDIVTLANAGELGPSATPATPPAPAPEPGPKPPAPAHQTYEQTRHAQEQAAADKEKPPATDPQQPTPAADRVKVGPYEVTADELAEFMTDKAQRDLKAATLPPSPDGYEAKLPADLKLPGGLEYKFDVNDPSLVAARNLAHAKGWSQQDFSEALGIFASHHVQQEAALAERSRQEIAKVGVNGPQRVDAVGKWITGMVGEADAAPIRATLVTDAHLRFYETLMHKISSQGSAGFSQSHRVPPDEKTIPGYDKMSFEQRRFAQDQLAAGRGGR